MKIHLHGGGESAQAAAESGVDGEHLAFREALIDGPVRAGLTDEEWVEMRATHLAATYGEDPKQMRVVSKEELAMIDTLTDAREIVLWFDRDLFCQANLMFVIGRLDECGFDGSFTLVESHAGDAASHDHSIRHLAIEEIEAYSRTWRAYGSPDPSTLNDLAATDLPDVLRGALALHMERFPSPKNGLGRPEATILELVGDAMSFAELFERFGEAEPGYGLGDAQVWSRLTEMASGSSPLLALEAGTGNPWDAVVRRTEAGQRVLSGEADARHLLDLERWIGGVVLTPRDRWTFDTETGRLVEG